MMTSARRNTAGRGAEAERRLRLEVIGLQQIIKGGAADPEQPGGARDIAFGAGERAADGLAVGDLARGLQVYRHRVGDGLEVEIGGGYALAVGHDRGTLHAILELANIARPA